MPPLLWQVLVLRRRQRRLLDGIAQCVIMMSLPGELASRVTRQSNASLGGQQQQL